VVFIIFIQGKRLDSYNWRIMLDIKVLYERLDASIDDEERMHIKFDIATFFLNTNEQRTLEYAEEINVLAEKLDSNLGRCYYHSTLGRVMYSRSSFDEAAVEFHRALELSLLTDDVLTQAICYDSLVVVYGPQNRYGLALENSLNALEIYKKMDSQASQWQMATCYNNIGIAHKNLYQLAEAEASYKKGVEIAEKSENERIKFIIFNNLAQVKVLQGKYDECLAYSVKAIDGFRKHNHKVGESYALVYMAHCQLGKGDYAQALQTYIETAKLLKDIDNKPVEVQLFTGMGNVYLKLEAYNEALNNYNKAFVIANTIGECRDLCEVYLCLGKAYQGLGDKVQSLDALSKGLQLAETEKLTQFISEFEQLLQGQIA
jgi:tetratricopeptide (TPR) repeat protein